MKNKRKLHKWTKKDYIMTFFITKYGTTLVDENKVSQLIGTSTTSVKKMMSNFRHLMGVPNQLSHIKNLQYEVFSEYNQKPIGEYMTEVKGMTKWDDIERQMILERMGVKNYRLISRREK